MPSQSREKQLLKIREERSHTQLFFFFLDGSVIFVFGGSRRKPNERTEKKKRKGERNYFENSSDLCPVFQR